METTDTTNYPKKYIRDRRGNPVGAIVATANGVGWSLCHKSDRKRFTKENAVKVAIARADFHLSGSDRVLTIPNSLRKDFDKMQIRREKYFRI